MHKDALSLQQQHKKVISVVMTFNLRVSHPRDFDVNPAFLSTICSLRKAALSLTVGPTQPIMPQHGHHTYSSYSQKNTY